MRAVMQILDLELRWAIRTGLNTLLTRLCPDDTIPPGEGPPTHDHFIFPPEMRR
jgi:hypothetical protein